MKTTLISIGSKSHQEKGKPTELLSEEYLKRADRLAPTAGLWVEAESDFWVKAAGLQGRSATTVLLMDSIGRPLTSIEFAESLRDFRDRGTQQLVVGIGGADGWSAESRSRAHLLVSMGRMTLPHSLARVVAAEQIYRAMTILAGHPYHCGH